MQGDLACLLGWAAGASSPPMPLRSDQLKARASWVDGVPVGRGTRLARQLRERQPNQISSSWSDSIETVPSAWRTNSTLGLSIPSEGPVTLGR